MSNKEPLGITNYKHKEYPIFYRIAYDTMKKLNIGTMLCCSTFDEKEVEVDFIIERIRLGVVKEVKAETWHKAAAFCKFGRDEVKASRGY